MMEGFLPCTKSFWSDCQLCPWKAAQHKIHRVKSKTTRGALIGLTVHRLVAQIRKDPSKLEEFQAEPGFFLGSEEFSDNEYQDIVDMTIRAFTSDPIKLSETGQDQLKIEAYFAIDEKGKLTKKKDAGLWRGYLDRVVLMDDGTVVVDDLKTERFPTDNVAERVSYVLGARALFPDATVVLFGRHYLRTGTYLQWRYEFKDGKTHTCIETTPEGEKIKHGPFGQNPLLVYLKDFVSKIEKMEPLPTPGPHCESWYGELCQFFGNECPIAEALPATIDESGIVPDDPDGLRPYNLLAAIVSTDNLPITKDQAEWAYSGAMQLEAFVKQLKKKIEAWSRTNGVIRIGATDYGWFTTQETDVDKACALSEMLRTMTVEEVAKVVSISKTSINTKISKRKYPELREFLLSMAVSEVDSKPRFGAIKNAQSE